MSIKAVKKLRKLKDQLDKIEDLSEDELNERISTIVSDNNLLLDPKSKDKDPKDKKPKPVLS